MSMYTFIPYMLQSKVFICRLEKLCESKSAELSALQKDKQQLQRSIELHQKDIAAINRDLKQKEDIIEQKVTVYNGSIHK